MFYKKISDNLTRWGKKSQKISPNNDTIKQNVLNSLRPALEETKTKHSFAWRWLMIAAVPALAILLMVTYNNTIKEIPIAYVSESEIDIGLTSESPIGNSGFGLADMAASNLSLRQEESSFLEKVVDKIRMPEPEPIMITTPNYYNGSKDITDTREYLKTNFSLQVATKKVEKNYTHIKTIIRGHGGRIDDSKLTQKYARLNFVIPKSSYNDFVEEVKSLFPEKFITLSENITNLLGQKQNIETQTEYASSSLEILKTERIDNIKKYDEKYTSLNKEINKFQRIMENIVEQRKTISSTEKETLKKLDNQLSEARQTHNNFVSELLRTMTKHEKDLENFDNQIKDTENYLSSLVKQDVALINNVETVSGNIYINWISFFEIINLYIPVYKTLIMICLLIIISYFLFGRKQKGIELP